MTKKLTTRNEVWKGLDMTRLLNELKVIFVAEIY